MGNAAEVFPFYFARVVKFGKGTALRMQSGEAYCGFETHRRYYAHIAEWNRRCTKDAVPETE